ncbi:hypothetical protein D3C85_1294030 [compost metagenome]
MLVLVTSRPVWISSLSTTSVPLPRDSGREATSTASYRFSAPSAPSAVPGRIEPTTTTGLSLLSVRFRKYDVSSMVSVPCVMTMPSTSGCFSSSDTRLASFSRRSLLKLSEPIWKICSPLTLATFEISGTEAMILSTGTTADW